MDLKKEVQNENKNENYKMENIKNENEKSKMENIKNKNKNKNYKMEIQMKLTKEEMEKLQEAKKMFNIHLLDRVQAGFVLGKKLTDKAWKAYETLENRNRKKIQDNVYSIKRLFSQSKQKPKKPEFSYSDIVKHAVKKARRFKFKQLDTDYRVAKLFKTKKNDYRIEKIQEYGYTKFNSTRSTWKVYGDVDIFHIPYTS